MLIVRLDYGLLLIIAFVVIAGMHDGLTRSLDYLLTQMSIICTHLHRAHGFA